MRAGLFALVLVPFVAAVGLTAAQEITALKPLYPDTPLVAAGQPACVIVVPDAAPAALAAARSLADGLRSPGAAGPEVLPDTAFVSAGWEVDFERLAGRQIIAFGTVNNNRLLGRLWGQGYVMEDDVFPGRGGHVIRTVHDPFARGINVVVLSAGDEGGFTAAADLLLARHAGRAGPERTVRGPVIEVSRGNPVAVYPAATSDTPRVPVGRITPPAAFAADLTQRVLGQVSRARDEAEARKPTLVNVTSVLAQLAEAWFRTGDPGYPPLMKRLVDEHRALLRVVPRRVEMEGASADHMLAWDLVEELPVWTDADRLEITNAFLRDALQGHEPSPAHRLVREGAVQVVTENHGTNSGVHTHNHWRYFAKYYDHPEEGYWTGVVSALFNGQLASHQVLEDSATYLISAPEDAEQHAFRSGDLRFFQTGIAASQMEFILQCSFSNLGLSTGFGDAQFLTYASGPTTVARIGWFLRDPRAAWWWRHYLPVACGLATYHAAMPVDDSIPLREPVEWTGLRVFPLYRQPLTRGQSSPVVLTAPKEPAGPEWFNKAVFREAWSPEAQYLLLDGAGVEDPPPGEPPGPNGHRHEDVNTIITLSDLGRLWLVDHTYSERSIEQHSGLNITRDGEFDYRLHQARLRNAAESGGLALTRSLFTDYSGSDWERTIFWRKGDHFLVLDRVIARQAGDFVLRANFRGLGRSELRPDGELRLEQAGRFFQIRPDGAPESALRTYRFPTEETWKANYPHAEPVAQILEQDRRVRLGAGESLAFANLLRAAPAGHELDGTALRRSGAQAFVVIAAGEKLLYGVGAVDAAELDCDAYAVGADAFLLAGVRRLGPVARPLVSSAGKADLWRDGAGVHCRLAESANVGGQLLPAGDHRLEPVIAAEIIRLVEEAGRLALTDSVSADVAETGSTPETAGAALAVTEIRLPASIRRLARADLDGDGTLEWVATGPEGVSVCAPDGTLRWRFSPGVACGALAVGDVDGDGRPEIALGDDANQVHLLDATGQTGWRFTCSATDRSAPPIPDQIEIVDLDADGRGEILVGANYLHCLGGDGTVRWEDYWEFRRGRRIGDLKAFAVSDYNRDGSPDIMTAIDLNYPVAVGYDPAGRRIYPADPAKRQDHRAIRVNPPQVILLADLFGDGGNEQIIVGATDRLNVRWAGGARDAVRAADLPGGRVALALAARPGERPFLYTANDLGAVLAYQASGSRDGAEQMELPVRWRRGLESRITTLWAGSPTGRPMLAAGLRSGAVRLMDGTTGDVLGSVSPRNSPVVQLLESGAEVIAVHADGLLRTISLPQDPDMATYHGVAGADFGKTRGPLAWSVAMAESEMKRIARTTVAPRWTYTLGLMALAYVRLGEVSGDTAWRNRGEGMVTQFLEADGAIRGYRAEARNLDLIAPGKVLLPAHARTGEPRLRRTIELLRQQLVDQPRTKSGGYWHKASYPNQMWLDGVFMAHPFQVDYGRRLDEPTMIEDTISQMALIDERTYDPASGLHRHAWDESRQETWADAATGRSPGHWSRGSGWWMMALVDVLELIPETHPRRGELLAMLARTAVGVVRWQDLTSGLWWQVTDQPGRERNYLEASASAMFTYALAKAVNRGWLPAVPYAGVARRGFAGLTGRLVRVEPDGTVSLTQCCAVAGLGRTNEAGRPRDGSFDYYVSEPVVDNDPKGVAPFILAGIEVEQLERRLR